jgi:transcriptional regulator with XRE-family HTH domain
MEETMKTNKNKSANHLWIARKKRRLSQKQVAHLLGHKSTAALSKYEHGERPPPLIIAIKLAVIYQSSIEELFPAIHREIKLEVLKAQLKNESTLKELS